MITNKIYDFWLKNLDSFQEELSLFPESKIDSLFNYNPFVFGTAGIRRIVGLSPQNWNIYTYRLISVGYAGYIKKQSENNHKVLVAHDNRPNGDKFVLEIANTLSACGIKVYLAPNNESISTPVVSYLIKKHGLSGGINITASHNAPSYNGFKCYNSTGCQTTNDEECVILENTPSYDVIFDIKTDSYSKFDSLDNDYFETLDSYVLSSSFHVGVTDEDKKIKCLLSAHRGTSCGILKKYASKHGFIDCCEYSRGGEISDNEAWNPEDIKSFEESTEYANLHGYKYQIAHDPDSDRCAMMEKQEDGSWYLFSGNQIAILFIDFLLKYNKETSIPRYIVSTYVSGNYIKRLCKDKNINIYITKTGFKNISKVVQDHEGRESLLLAFEEAIGCLLFPFNREKDGFQQTIILLYMIVQYKKSGISILGKYQKLCLKHGHWIGLTRYFESKDLNWKTSFKQKMDKILGHEAVELFGHSINAMKCNEDTVEMLLEEDNWIKFRISGTEPKFKIYYNLYGAGEEQLMITINQFHEYFKNYFGF